MIRKITIGLLARLLRKILDFWNNLRIKFPQEDITFRCGICSMLSIEKKSRHEKIDTNAFLKSAKSVALQNSTVLTLQDPKATTKYYKEEESIRALLKKAKSFRSDSNFLDLIYNQKSQDEILLAANVISSLLKTEQVLLKKQYKALDKNLAIFLENRIELLRDIVWCLENDLIGNLHKVKCFDIGNIFRKNSNAVLLFKHINLVLNSIDRLEVRGRDSAGISLLFILNLNNFNSFQEQLSNLGLTKEFKQRQSDALLTNRSISCNESGIRNNQKTVAVNMTYKVASEVGSLGDNTKFLREEIKSDHILYIISSIPRLHYTISSHTRWASVGAITEPNCHPIDNIVNDPTLKKHIIHVCLNGEIDNHIELIENSKVMGTNIQKEITTDTKIIPIKIEEYINKGIDISEAFRLAVNNFKGSHAIVMHTDLAPGKLFVAQKGSGQGMFIGLTENSYIITSEVYGFVEETSSFLRMEGHKVICDRFGNEVQGEIFILDKKSKGKPNNIKAMYYNGTPKEITKYDIDYTEITSRDVNRKNFKHFFLKEVYEAPTSVERTLNGRWYLEQQGIKNNYTINLGKKIIPESLRNAFRLNLIKYIFFIGQGTAGVAAEACSNILGQFLIETDIHVHSLRASEFSGFQLSKYRKNKSLKDSLVVAITQSGTTTDTNRSVDMACNREAYTLAVVNRRDSDITFKVDGIMYTSSGRDIEMSVASTKAFYSQITAGTLLCLKIVDLTQAKTKEFISSQIHHLLGLPGQMRKVLNTEKSIKRSAQRLASTKRYWATVGSGSNKVSADEVRIKLSELCYKTISSDFIEDKKHIDLSSEPLILAFTAGSNENTMEDIKKDIAIFKAHRATTVVVAHENEKRFEPYAEDVFYVPKVISYLAPILNTLVGHIWGYYAALSINKDSKVLSNFRDNLKKDIDRYTSYGIDAFEIVSQKSFRSKINKFCRYLRLKTKKNKQALDISNSTDLILLLKYLSGKLPVSDFEMDFGEKGTSIKILECFFKTIESSISDMSRPIDAIRHQAKTVTVGTSRVSSKVDGILFSTIKSHGIMDSQITDRNIVIIKNLQETIKTIQGSMLYTITKLNFLGEPDSSTQIEIKSKSGILKSMPSRVERDKGLKGIKRIVVSKGETYIGKGRKDDENVIIIPVYSNVIHEFNKIRYLLLLNVVFKEKIPLQVKIKALGNKYDGIKNVVQENTISWEDGYIDGVKTEDLFGLSAEKIGEHIVSQQLHTFKP